MPDFLTPEKIYTEAEFRHALSQAYIEAARVVVTALSYQTARLQLLRRAEEIKIGGALRPPPR